MGLNVVKISFLIQFYRIFPDRRVRQICVYFAFFSFLWMIGQNILYALSCVPTTGLVNNPHLNDICVPTLPVCKSTPDHAHELTAEWWWINGGNNH